jgi:hypothetical protein
VYWDVRWFIDEVSVFRGLEFLEALGGVKVAGRSVYCGDGNIWLRTLATGVLSVGNRVRNAFSNSC